MPVLAQAVFHALDALFGDRGLILAQMAAAFVGFALLARGVQSDLVLVFVMIGSLPLLLVVHAELFSLALMPLMLLLLEEERWNLWLAVPLLAVWSNLHGSVLVGLALLLVYVAVSHRGRWPVAVCGVAAVCLTPALWNTPAYYVGVARNEAARRGVGFWHPLDLRPFDLLLVACVVVLVAVGRRRYRGWEAVAAIGLAAATIHAERLGVWLLFLTAYPAGRAVRTVGVPKRYVPALAVAFAALAIAGLVHPPLDAGSRPLAHRAARTHEPVLAEPILAEQVEAYGGRVWVADPFDAFRRPDQRLYLDWLAGHGAAAVGHARWVLVASASDAGRAAKRDARLKAVARDRDFVLYRVR